MVDRGGELRLGLEAVPEVEVVGELGRDHLERDGAIEAQLGGAVDHAHAALAGHAVDAVAAEDRPALHVGNGWGHASDDERPRALFPYGSKCLDARRVPSRRWPSCGREDW